MFCQSAVIDQAQQIEGLTAMMFRRGPDDEGMWTDNKHCIFGFKRLSILDLSLSGHQPMVTLDQRYVINFNGEIYNFKEIREELEGRGVKFKSSGDTEVVLQALICWGKDALDRFNGMFALAFYDSKAKKIILARDHAGIKPLYYLVNSEGLLFASQYDQILAHPWSKKEKISQDALGLYLRFAYIPPPYALLSGTKPLEPGSWIEIDANRKVNTGRYFEYSKYEEPILFGEKAYEAVDEAVTNAVRRQLISDVPVGAFLSGGIDSPLVVSKMKRAGISNLRAFTIAVDGEVFDFDKVSDAISYAKEINVNQTIEYFNDDYAVSMLPDVVAACGEPFADASIFPTMLVAKLAKSHGIKVVLSGDGGDELFWGYANRLSAIIKNAENFKQSYVIRSAKWGLKKYLGWGNGHLKLRYKSIGDWHQLRHMLATENLLQEIFLTLPAYPRSFYAYKYNGFNQDECAQWLRWNEYTYHLGMILMKVDRASMYNSVEVRVPLLDREVVDVSLKVDWKSCVDLKNTKGKIPLRKALAKHVLFQTQTKRGFSIPMSEWLRGKLLKTLQDNLLDRKEICGLALKQKFLKKIIDDHCSGKEYSRILWTLLSLSFWEKKHGVRHVEL